MAQNVSLELWLGIGVSTWHSLSCSSEWHPSSCGSGGRWTRGTLELWLGLASVAGVSVRVVGRTAGLDRLPSLVWD